MTMQRRHFEQIAKAMKEARAEIDGYAREADTGFSDGTIAVGHKTIVAKIDLASMSFAWDICVAKLADMGLESNPRFDTKRFMEACGSEH